MHDSELARIGSVDLPAGHTKELMKKNALAAILVNDECQEYEPGGEGHGGGKRDV